MTSTPRRTKTSSACAGGLNLLMIMTLRQMKMPLERM